MQLVFGSLALLVLIGGTIFGVLALCALAIRFLQEAGDRLAQAVGCGWFVWVAILAAIVVIAAH